MGEIYLAAGGEVGGFEKLCVIKKVITEKADRNKANRFLDEAKVVLRLSHSALVNTFDAGEVDGEFYIAMELIEGKDLREVWNRCVRTRQRIPLDVALHVVREVARALAYVHEYGDLKLVHRDVAPPNILLAYVGDVKLTDFGLARSILKKEHTAPGVVFGRAAYLSPEQARGEMADARTDIYTLGIVLWELLTGQQFLQLGGLDPAAALALVRHPKLVPPSKRAPWITPALDHVALRALAPDRKQRFQSADEFRQALTTVIAEIAPTADSSRVGDFLESIYADTINEEHAERERFLHQEIPSFRNPPSKSKGEASEEQAGEAGQGENAEAEGAAERPERVASAAPAFLTATGPNGGLKATVPEERTDLERTGKEEVLAERYRIARTVFEAAEGALCAATDSQTGQEVSVFVFRSGVAVGEEPAFRAALTAASVQHPHLASVLDVGRDQERLYVVYEALVGADLVSLLAREQRLEPKDALRIALETTEAVAAAQAASAAHGSLRPSCVFLAGPRNEVKLLGFGSAALLGLGAGPLGAASSLPPGVMEYLAPEQIAGAKGDERTDFYGVGLLLYELCTGAPAYAGTPEILASKKQSLPQSPRLFRPDLAPELEALILRLLEPDPAQRLVDAADLATTLRRLHKEAELAPPAPAAAMDESRRRQRREAAFRAIAQLAGRVGAHAPPGAGSAQSAPPVHPGRFGRRFRNGSANGAGNGASRVSPSPISFAQGASAALAAASAPAPAFFPSPEEAPSSESQPTQELSPVTRDAPTVGGGLLARYGLGSAADKARDQRRIFTMAVVAIVAVAALVGLILSFGGDGSESPHRPVPTENAP